jgi:hypothetical protein
MRLMESTSRAITYFLAEEAGTSMMEYVLVGLLCFIVGILALLALGKSL